MAVRVRAPPRAGELVDRHSQGTQAARDSSAPPDPSQSGQPTTAEPQNIPASPHPQSPNWVKVLSQTAAMARGIASEGRAAGGGIGGYAGAAVSAMRGGGGAGGGGDTGSAPDGGEGDGGFGMPKGLGTIGGIGGALGGLYLANKAFQNAGEQIQRYKNLGGERGGGAVEGVGYEAQAQAMALNPFLTLEQSRSIMQSALRSGYSGKEFDTLTGFMADNLKNMNMQATDSMKLFNDTVVGGKQSIESLKQQMKDIHDLSATGRVGQTEKIAQNVAAADLTGEMGFEGEGQRNVMNMMTEGFAEDPVLAHIAPGAIGQAMQNPQFMLMVGQQAGIAGVLPEEIPEALDEKGPNAASNAITGLLRNMAQQAHNSAPGSELRAVSLFQMRLKMYGMPLQRREAKEMYRFLMSGKDPSQVAEDRRASARGRQTMGESTGFGDVVGEFEHAGAALGDLAQGDYGGAWNNFKALFSGGDDEGGGDVNGSYQAEGTEAPVTRGSSAYGPSGRPPARLPTTAGQAGGNISTSGQVNGQLIVTVDQQGRVSAPQTVRLSGNQTAVNAGYGGATLNNPAPGDQNYLHSNQGMG